MKHAYSILFITIVLLSSGLFAQEQATTEVETIAVCTSVENKQPVGTDSVFAADVGKLYCFTKIKSQTDTTEISHVWFFDDKEMTKVDLAVKAKTWRTWSAKTILPEWKGDWRVEVRDSEGHVITSVSFKLK
jgi:hypothetical protein